MATDPVAAGQSAGTPPPGSDTLPSLLFIVGQLTRGGAEQQLYNLLRGLPVPVTVLALAAGGYWAGPIRQLGHTVIEFERRGRLDLSRIPRIRGVIRLRQPDVTHIFIDGVSGLYGRIGALLAGQRCVVVGERNHPTHHPGWYRALLPVLNPAVAAVICNAQASADYHAAHGAVPLRKLHVIPNGIDVAALADAAPPDAWPWPDDWRGKVIVGMVGRVTEQKNPALFIEVAARVAAENPDVRFVLVGDGPLLEKTRQDAAGRGVARRIHFAGERHDVPALLKTFDVFLLTSRYEGTSNAVLEAMAAGLPCVVTDVGAARQIVAEGETGWVVPADDTVALAGHVLGLAGNADQRRAMGERGTARVRQEYDLSVMIDRYKALYRELAGR